MTPDDNIYHVYPQSEEYYHLTNDKEGLCQCEPELIPESGGIVIVHNRLFN
jgi:hypothetical protein